MKRMHFLLFCTLGGLCAWAGVAQAETRLEKSLKLEPGGTLYVETGGGDIVVKGTQETGARVVVTSNLSDLESAIDLDFEEAPHAVRIVARRRSDISWPRHLRLKFEIAVPHQTSLELKTRGGDVEASELRGNLEAATSGGDMKVRELSGNLELHTSGGDISAKGIGGRVDVHTSGGDVEVGLVRGNALGGEVETSGGNIHVALDPAVNMDLEVSAGGGDIDSDLSLTVLGTLSPSHLRATLGKGGEMLSLHTSGGSIHIHAL